MNYKLTTTKIATLRAKSTRYRVWDSEIQGFHVRVTPTGKKTFVLTYRHEGSLKEYTIGKYGNLTVEEARRLARKLSGQVADNIDVHAERKARNANAEKKIRSTLERFYSSMYLPWAETNLKGHKEATRTIQSDFGHLLKRNLNAITQWDIQKWAAEMQKKGLKNTTLNRRIATLKGVLSKAKEWGIIDQSPLAGMKALKTDNAPNIRYLSDGERERLYSALKTRQDSQRTARRRHNAWASQRKMNSIPLLSMTYTDYLMPLVLVAINTGMRRGELFDLRWSDVSLSSKLISVRGETTKSGYTRHIPLTDEASSCLAEWKAANGSRELVFPSPVNGKRLDNINSSWKGLMKRAQIENFRFHDLRHHFASSLVMRGVDLNTVRELLGHRDLKTTLCYAHLAPEHKAAAISMLNTSLSP
ncbi:MAG: tyrosine-type recombinase/integrase [Pseudomonadales bacterium]|jgi:integrase|nr:tyrosine-type recombinase/integrase [Pseudomonadales bacterium]